jgi:two-component system, OmpR family, aerobic respiration control sensor histidine kinase ArcB
MNRFDPIPATRPGPELATREFSLLAHDIRGALQGVIGGLNQLEHAALDAAARMQVERAAAAATKLACLVRTAIGDLPDTLTEANHETVETRRLLRYLRRRWRGEAAEKNLDFRLEASEGLPDLLLVELVPLARVLSNLIGNAIKFTDRGQVTLRARRDAAGGVEFVVEDEGPGLRGQNSEEIFTFGTRSNWSTKPGQGLGLHIVKTLTDDIGGSVSIGERTEGGVEAILRLPPELCAANPMLAERDADIARTLPDLGGVCILLAEDNPTNQLVAAQMLESLNARVSISADGIEALERFAEGDYDLVIVDIEMPRMSGIEVIRAIRSRSDARAGTPIVALTAYAMPEHRNRIADAGANGLISKPIVSVAAFGHALERHLVAPRPAPPAQEVPEPDSSERSIDLTIFDALCQAIGPEMMGELLEKVVLDLRAVQATLESARVPLDPEAIRSASHILVSVAGAIGATRLQMRARRLNTAAHSGTSDTIAAGLDACLSEIGTAVAFARERRKVN